MIFDMQKLVQLYIDYGIVFQRFSVCCFKEKYK